MRLCEEGLLQTVVGQSRRKEVLITKLYEAFWTSPISQDLLETQNSKITRPLRQPKWEIQMLIKNLTNHTNHRKIENPAGN